MNFLPAIFLYKEPESKKEQKSVKNVISDMKTAFSDKDFIIFLLIFSGFWLMFMQLWDLLPNFIDQWIDSRGLAKILPHFMTDNGNVKAEQLINIDAFAIIALMVPLSALIGKLKRLTAITIGVILTTFAFLGSGLFMSGTIVAIMIFIFALGEMTCSPKFSEYIGVNAPADKKALYMGLSNIPFAIGWILGNGISGPLYDKFANKIMLSRDYLTTHLNYSHEKISQIIETYKQTNPDKLLPETLNKITVDTFDFFPYLVKTLHKSSFEVNKILWDLYHPWIIWVILSGFGLITIISMWIFSIHKSRRQKQV
jgi:hypothetical protein